MSRSESGDAVSGDDRAVSRSYNFPGFPTFAGVVPSGYRETVRSREIGRGRAVFEAAVGLVLHWQVHYGSGFVAIEVPDAVTDGAESVWGIPFGPFRPRVACRVFGVIDEPGIGGFGHGALEGHPQSGWESYLVRLDDDGRVFLDIRVVWRPAAWWMRAAGPFGALALHILLRKNLRALDGLLPASD
jgi:uncharacterized protein (UPF0548 family)